MKTSIQIAQEQNKAIEQRLIAQVKSYPIHKESETTVHDEAYNRLIVELSENQNQKLKNLLDENIN